jgi:hypothetical protein
VSVEPNVFNQNVNLILQAITNTLNKQDVLSELSVVAAKAFESVVLLLNDLFDSESHATALLLLKSICQN